MKMEYIFIKQKDEYCVSQEMFQNFLCINKRIKLKNEEDNKSNIIIFDEQNLEYRLEFTEVEKSNEIIFHLIVEIQGAGEEQAGILEKFDSLVKEINEKNGALFSINTIWNDVSSYYGKKLYSDISKVENMLRKIIYLFMLKTVGSKWIEVGTPEKFKVSINNVIEKNNKAKNDINAEWLIYADFITLGYFFTAPYSRKSDLKELFNELKQYGINETLNDEEKQNGNKKKGKKVKVLTSDIIGKMSDEYEPKNNWDRYFSDKLGDRGQRKFSDDWGSLYNIRNKVAHGRPINKADFKKANELIELFTMTFDKCIEIIDTLEITVEEAKAVEAVAQQVIQKEQEGIFEREKLLERLKITGAVSDSVLRTGNILSNVSNDLLGRGIFTSDTLEIEPTLLNMSDKGLTLGIQHTNKMLAPLLSQIIISPEVNESLKVDRITAALDEPIILNSPLSSLLGINGNTNLAAKQKTDFLDVEATDSKIQISSSENPKNEKK